jgi:hypothetical protein
MWLTRGCVVLSDWGQWVRGLKLGSDHAPLRGWVGVLESYSLLSGHLVRRYSNRSNPDYHPAGTFLSGKVGPLYTEAFASDVLGARLLGAEVSLDVQHVFFGKPQQRGRYTLALSAEGALVLERVAVPVGQAATVLGGRDWSGSPSAQGQYSGR